MIMFSFRHFLNLIKIKIQKQYENPLGRWCHPSSHNYKLCDQSLKNNLANKDNCFGTYLKDKKS